MKARLAGAALALVSACASRPPPAPDRSADARVSPGDLIPRDLDFVVRFDGQALPGAIAAVPDFAKAAAPFALVDATLLRGARSVVFGGRRMSDGLHGDGVVVVEQRSDTEAALTPGPEFRQLAPRGGARPYERREGGRRDEAALQVVLPAGFVLATPSEADAVLRVLDAGPDRDRLAPPARGLLSFAGRVPAGMTRGDWPAALRPVGEGLVRYEGSVAGSDAPSDLRAEAELVYASSDTASAAANAIASTARALALSRPRWRAVAQSVHVVQAGTGLRVDLTVPFALAGAVQ